MALKTTLWLVAAAVATLALPAFAAGAEYLVPPGNSAAIQYTETYPSAGGHKDAEHQRGNRNRSPEKVLGERNAQRLQEHGAEGEAVAEVVAETAPETPAPASEGSGVDSYGGDKPKQGKREETDGENSRGGAGAGSGSQGGPNPPSTTVTGDVDQSGSSGFGEVLASAFGAPPGGGGALLPLAFLGTLAWMLVFAWRQRKKQSA